MRHTAVLLLALLCFVLAERTVAETVTAPALKAAFLYNFAKFTEWPPEALRSAAPIEICFSGDAQVANALEEVTRGHDVAGHRLVLRRVDPLGTGQTCHMLYVADLTAKTAIQVVERVKGVPVLAVSDFQGFASIGGNTEFFVEGGRMRFAVNLEATQRSGLRLSSKLLTLAKTVEDDPNASKP